MSNDIKKMHHYGLYKIFKYHKHLFPCKITKVHIKHIGDDNFSFVFINEKDDVTSLIVNTPELYQKFLDAVIKIKSQFTYNEEKYFEPFEQKVKPSVYLDRNVVSKLRGNKSVLELSSAIDLHTSTIYSIERGEEISTSLKTAVNYSLFFKTPIYKLFITPYKKEFLNIILNYFMIKGYIKEDLAKEIYNKEV